MSQDTPLPGSDAGSGLSRRGLIRNAAGAGAAGLAAAALVNATAGSATAAAPDLAGASAAEHPSAAAGEESLIVHVRDARTGEMDVFRGEGRHTVRDRALAAALIRAAH